MQRNRITKTRFPSDAKGLRNEVLQFERLISELSTDFINLPFDQVDKKIKDSEYIDYVIIVIEKIIRNKLKIIESCYKTVTLISLI